MNGGHDLGGMMGFGPVEHLGENEPPFHHRWEGRMRGLFSAMGKPLQINIDQGRFARENVPPGQYLTKSYFEIWYDALVKMALERGLITREELAAGHAIGTPKSVVGIVDAQAMRDIHFQRKPYDRPVAVPAKFAVGQIVRARNIHPAGHTRLPRYVRGHLGVIEMIHGAHVFPDSNAAGKGEAPQWLYNVRFTGAELWGENADPTSSVAIDAWESYLERV